MISLDIKELLPRFGSFRVAFVQAEGLQVTSERSEELESFVHEAERRVGELLMDVELGNVTEIKAWRKAYREFGVKKTSYRCSTERLLKAVQKGNGLPQISNFVDAYNTVSITWRMHVGADDLDKVVQPQAFRFARDGDTFIPLSDKHGTEDPPNVGEVVYADAEKCLCRRWNWYQDVRSAVGPNTKCAVLTVQAIEPTTAAKIENAVEDLCSLLGRVCSAQTRWVIADANSPKVSLC